MIKIFHTYEFCRPLIKRYVDHLIPRNCKSLPMWNLVLKTVIKEIFETSIWPSLLGLTYIEICTSTHRDTDVGVPIMGQRVAYWLNSLAIDAG